MRARATASKEAAIRLIRLQRIQQLQQVTWTWARYPANATRTASLSHLTDSVQRFDHASLRLREPVGHFSRVLGVLATLLPSVAWRRGAGNGLREGTGWAVTARAGRDPGRGGCRVRAAYSTAVVVRCALCAFTSRSRYCRTILA